MRIAQFTPPRVKDHRIPQLRELVANARPTPVPIPTTVTVTTRRRERMRYWSDGSLRRTDNENERRKA